MYAWPDWAKLENLYDIDYGDKVLKSIIATNYIKQKFSILLILSATLILRLHLVTILGFMFSYNFYLDLITQIIISVILTLHSDILYNILAKYNEHFYKLSKIIIDNYSPENFRLWKRNITCGICFYLIIILIVFEVNSNLLIIYIIQYMVTYLIIDQFEQKRIERFINNIRSKPQKIIYGELNIINDYFEEEDNNINKKENYQSIEPEQSVNIYESDDDNTVNYSNNSHNSNYSNNNKNISLDSSCNKIIDSGMDELLKDLSIMEEQEKQEEEEIIRKEKELQKREKELQRKERKEQRRISKTNSLQFVILDDSNLSKKINSKKEN